MFKFLNLFLLVNCMNFMQKVQKAKKQAVPPKKAAQNSSDQKHGKMKMLSLNPQSKGIRKSDYRLAKKKAARADQGLVLGESPNMKFYVNSQGLQVGYFLPESISASAVDETTMPPSVQNVKLPFAATKWCEDDTFEKYIELTDVMTSGWKGPEKKGVCTQLVTQVLRNHPKEGAEPEGVTLKFVAEPRLSGCMCYLKAVHNVFGPFNLVVDSDDSPGEDSKVRIENAGDVHQYCFVDKCNNGHDQGKDCPNIPVGAWNMDFVQDPLKQVQEIVEELQGDSDMGDNALLKKLQAIMGMKQK